MTTLRAGQLNRRITLQAPVATLDTYGVPTPGWTDIMTLWATIEPLSGRELVNAQRIASEISHQITVRYLGALTDTRIIAGYRALYKGRIFNIHAAMNEDESNVLITLLASEGLNDG